MRLFFYILRDYVKYVVGTTTLTVFLFVLFDFIHRSTKEFADFHPRPTLIAKYYLYQIPAQVVQALPIAALLASVITMILLSRTNEITAMRAAGMGPRQIGAPLAFGGLVLSVLALSLGELVVPRLAQDVHYIHEVQISGEKDEQIAGGAKWVRSGAKLINFQDYDTATKTLSGLQIVEVLPNFKPVLATQAATATYLPDIKQWLLNGIKVLRFRRGGALEGIEDLSGTETMALPIEPAKLKLDRRSPNELSIAELSEQVSQGEQSGANTLPAKVELHGKLAYPFAAFVVSLIGLKFGYKSERATETTKGVLLAFAIGISYWFIMSAGRALGLRGDIPPLLATWMANVLILAIITVDAWLSRQT